jgi:pSer/pThr/pTyr-binding forkhead associated (FHA) protein
MWILRSVDSPPETGPLTFRLTAGAVKTLGRAARADFVVDATLVSRFHCRFTVGSEGSLLLEDLDSTNGTFVNDKQVPRATLTQGDRVRAGRVEFAVERG